MEKTYYVVPIYPVLMAGGAVAAEKLLVAPKLNWARIAYAAILVIAGAVTVPFGVPVLPVSSFINYSSALPVRKIREDGSRYTRRTSAALRRHVWLAESGQSYFKRVLLDPLKRAAGLRDLAGNYGEAGAIDYYGRQLGLPPAISGHNNHWFWGPRNYTASA